MMNTVYDISLPQNDFEGAIIEPIGYVKIPSFACSSCGCDGSTTDVWYASLQPTTPKAIEFARTGFPEKVGNYKAYLHIRDELREAFQTNGRFLPGSIIGARPIEVLSQGLIGGLTTKKLEDGIDFIAAGFSWIVSERIFRVMQRYETNATFGNVIFHAADAEVEGYRVIQLEPQAIWTEAERRKYELSICDTCGSSFKRSSKGTFAKKQHDGSYFREGYAIVRGAESRSLFINEALYQGLISLAPKGVSFTKAGEWI